MRFGPLHFAELDDLELPTGDWHRVRRAFPASAAQISATLSGASSRYFESIVSFPFVLGHEIVGEIVDGGDHADDELSSSPCSVVSARGITPLCPACAEGRQRAHAIDLPSGIYNPAYRLAFARIPAVDGPTDLSRMTRSSTMCPTR